MADVLLKERRRDVFFLTLNRPDKRNALNPELVQHLLQTLKEIQKDSTIRAVVLTGAGRAFCAGADLAYLKAMQNFSQQENEQDSRQLADLFATLYSLPRITVAMVNGPALAGGCGLATVCDFIIADEEKARFGYPEVRIGFIPALVANFLIRRIPPAQALEIMMSGKILTAEQAHRLGLVSLLAEPGKLPEVTEAFIKDLLEQNSFQAMVQIKKLSHRLMDLPLKDGIQLAAEENVAARYTQDCQRGLAAFLRKEQINWRD